MKQVRTSVVVSLILGILSVLAIGASHLALTDIWHGESDVSLEWNVLRLAALVILAFHLGALTTLWRVMRSEA